MIGWFLARAARSEVLGIKLENILGKLCARDVMYEDYSTISPGLPLQTVFKEHIRTSDERAFVVANGDSVVGLLTTTDLSKAPRSDWGRTAAQRVMTPRAQVVTVDAGAEA